MTMNSLSSFQIAISLSIAQHRSFIDSCVMFFVIERIISKIWRSQSVTYAIRIVLFAHFYDTVWNVMSIEIICLRWRWIQRIDVVKVWRWRRRRRRRCLTTIHVMLKLIDTQIIVVVVIIILMLLMMIMMMMAIGRSAIVGLCGPALWYSWSFCVRSVRRIIIREMWQADWLIAMSHITWRRGCCWRTWK